jgi:hypothetical protein
MRGMRLKEALSELSCSQKLLSYLFRILTKAVEAMRNQKENC